MKNKNIIKVLKTIEQICRDGDCNENCCLKSDYGCGLIHGGLNYEEVAKRIKEYDKEQNKNNN